MAQQVRPPDVVTATGEFISGDNNGIPTQWRKWVTPPDPGDLPGYGLVAADDFGQSAGALSGKGLDVGGDWLSVGFGADFEATGSGQASRLEAGGNDHYEIAGTTAHALIHVEVDVTMTVGGYGYVESHGIVLRYVNASNLLRVGLWPGQAASGIDAFSLDVGYLLAGTPVDLFGTHAGQHLDLGEAVALGTPYRLVVEVDTAGVITVWVYKGGAGGVLLHNDGHGQTAQITQTVNTNVAPLATGGALATGKVGLFDFDEHPGTGSPPIDPGTRYWDNFTASAVT